MARESVKILQGKLDVESLIAQLNAALAEEWLAYYQYWVGALVVEGAMRADVQGEFEEHAEEERRHAQLLADRIIELEGVPVLDPKQWFELARCKYDAPQGFDSVSLLKDNVASERCAILRYQEIADFTTLWLGYIGEWYKRNKDISFSVLGDLYPLSISNKGKVPSGYDLGTLYGWISRNWTPASGGLASPKEICHAYIKATLDNSLDTHLCSPHCPEPALPKHVLYDLFKPTALTY